jgi:hypothetical protein
VILDINFPDIFKYEVDRNATLPSVGPASKLIDDDEGFPPQGNLVDDEPYTQFITKEVLTNDRKHLGHVDGFDNINIIVKDGLFNPQYYKVPRAKVEGYQNGKVLLNISEQDTKRQFKKKYPRYFK